MLWLKGDDSIDQFKKIIEDSEQPLFAKLHAVWGLGQLARLGNEKIESILLPLLTHSEEEIRANVARLRVVPGSMAWQYLFLI